MARLKARAQTTCSNYVRENFLEFPIQEVTGRLMREPQH